jgi:DNA-binding CsgD family transcriptional regulator
MGEDPTKVRRSQRTSARGDDEVPCLDVLEGRTKGARHWIADKRAVLGRSGRADVEFDDDGVSREHARITIDEDDIVSVVDLGSTNGTFVNEAPVDATVVRPGDRIRLGPDLTLQFWWRPKAEIPATAAMSTIDLSAREVEIARLVAEGLTNAEIAARLGISPHTVMTHLSNVFARAGLASRAELAALVASDRVRSIRKPPRGGS